LRITNLAVDLHRRHTRIRKKMSLQ